MATAFDVITGALERINANAANSEPTDEDVQICARALNTLLDSLSNTLLNIFTIQPKRFMMVSGQRDYTVGPAVDDSGNPTGADWVIPRPMRIENAVMMVYPTIDGSTPPNIGENSGTLFFDLELLNYSQYASITVRDLTTTWPTSVYDNGGYPLRTLSFWPVPQMTLACELWAWEPLTDYTSLLQPLNLPPGYERYLILKLAMEIAPTFGKQITDTLKATLREAESAIKTLNQTNTQSRATSLGRGLSKRTPDYVSNDAKYNRVPRTW